MADISKAAALEIARVLRMAADREGSLTKLEGYASGTWIG